MRRLLLKVVIVVLLLCALALAVNAFAARDICGC